MLFFSLEIYLKGIFYTAYLKFFILTKTLNAAQTHTEMKQNLLHRFFFIKIFIIFSSYETSI